MNNGFITDAFPFIDNSFFEQDALSKHNPEYVIPSGIEAIAYARHLRDEQVSIAERLRNTQHRNIELLPQLMDDLGARQAAREEITQIEGELRFNSQALASIQQAELSAIGDLGSRVLTVCGVGSSLLR